MPGRALPAEVYQTARGQKIHYYNDCTGTNVAGGLMTVEVCLTCQKKRMAQLRRGEA